MIRTDYTKMERLRSYSSIFSRSVFSDIIEYDDYIVVNKEIKPNEEMGISWDIIVNTAGLKNVDVKEIRSYLTSVTVSARNQNAYYTFYSYN